MRYFKLIFYILFFSLFCAKAQELNNEGLFVDNNIVIVDFTGISNQEKHPIAYAKSEFFRAVEDAGGIIESIKHYTQTQQKVYLILGTLDNYVVEKLIIDDASIISNKPEGIFYQWRKTEKGLALIVGGTDAIGFMYALTELAQQIKDKGLSALTALKNTVEFPDNQIRGLDKFVTDENDDSWFFSEEYWRYYIKQLAENRFNRLTLITGYNDGSKEDFMMPVYPYLIKVPGFEDVKPKNSLLKSPEEYLAQLRRIGEISHNYGLEFVFGIWSHGRSNGLISGLPEDDEEFTKYCSNGMRELLRKAPEIDGIQLRVNYESGVGGFGDTADNFWKEIITTIGDINKERKGNLFLDLRAKGLTLKIREWAIDTGIEVDVTSKYTWEGVGLPYHPTEMRKAELAMLDNNDKRQRYGYADFLYKSRDFDYINRLWGIGTIRMFTWADPDYAKRFSHTTSFGGARGFQVTPPLARKQNTWHLFTDDSLVYYNWEDQRYWAWHLLFGRLGYSKETNPEVWQRAFKEHYGNSYEAVLDAYSAAGKVLPLITSSHLTYHPANYNWAEIESGGALFFPNNASPFHKSKERTYQSAEPGDPGLFYGIEDYVKDVLKEDIKPKINPVQLASLYEKLSKETLESLSKVNKEDIPVSNRKEYVSNEGDLKITAALASYHSFKIKAATDFVFFKETQKKEYLKSSLNNMEVARNNWKDIVVLSEKLYYEKPFFLHDNGTWKDRLIEIEKDISELQEILGESNNMVSLSHWDKFDKVNKSLVNNFDAIVPEVANANKDLKITLITNKILEGDATPKVHYRIANMASGKFKELKMQWDGANYTASISANYLDSEFDLLIYFASTNENGHVTMYPGLFHEKCLTPYYVVEIN
jgi:hypothetical protein